MLLDEVKDIGRNPRTGGYQRFAWTDADMAMREWFSAQAQQRGLDLVEDNNGNQIAWWGSGPNAILLGSHLDSVPEGGAFDGPLGVASAFEAIDVLRNAGIQPTRPIAIVNFTDEEGARFGVACIGSQLATGVLSPERALALRDADGITMSEALDHRDRRPEHVGKADWLNDIALFLELHIEQGRGLIHHDAPVGVASAIWPHGRWRFDFCGEANHAGATLMADRHDPMLAYAATALAARELAQMNDHRVTFGKLAVSPGATNAIPSRVQAWLDARSESEESLDEIVTAIIDQAKQVSSGEQTTVEVSVESRSPAVEFDASLRNQIAGLLDAPVLATGAGHDAGILAARMPTAMLFVRNPTGVSHSPAEYAEADDCDEGVHALVRVLEELI